MGTIGVIPLALRPSVDATAQNSRKPVNRFTENQDAEPKAPAETKTRSVARCTAPKCVPKSASELCAAAKAECGELPDGCGGTVDCSGVPTLGCKVPSKCDATNHCTKTTPANNVVANDMNAMTEAMNDMANTAMDASNSAMNLSTISSIVSGERGSKRTMASRRSTPPIPPPILRSAT